MKEQKRVVFDNLFSVSEAMSGRSEPMSSANPFQQPNAQGELKCFDDIATVAKASGKKFVTIFSAE